VTRVDKTRGELVAVIGPYEQDVITYDGVYQSFLEEKRIWGKDSGRMYAHNIISWHEDEPITPEQALEFGKEFAEQWFDGFQSLVGVHIDRNHVHCHIVTNSVSFMDGHKLHNTKRDLQRMKDFTNQMCVERGLSVAQKGRDFHGNELEQGTVSAWSKDKYHLMQNEAKDSFVADCGIACLDALEVSCSREEFIRHMAERGWNVIWKDSRKHITFQNAEGKKVRDSNLSGTFHLNISKEALANEFERQAAGREQTARFERELAARREREEAELERYYREVQAAAGGAVRDDSYTERYHQRTGEAHPSADIGYWETEEENIGVAKQSGAGKNQSDRTIREQTIREGFANLAGTESGMGMEEESRKSRAGYEPDGTELFLADIRSQVRDSESQRQNRETERCRRSAAGERKAKEAERGVAKERERIQRESGERDRSC
jgi:Relaxase/Mobilisation nuclease domain.